jgi:ABC-type sugar transport system permease subunit
MASPVPHDDWGLPRNLRKSHGASRRARRVVHSWNGRAVHQSGIALGGRPGKLGPAMKTYLVYGVINAIASALLNLILYLTGYQTEKLSTGQYLGYIGIVIFFVVIFLGMRETREAKPDKAITYGGALGAAVMIALFSGLFGSVYNFIHFSYINPDYPQYVADLTRQKLEAKGLPEAQIDSAIKMSGMFVKPVAMAILGTIGSVIMGTIGGLILAIFVKREPAPLTDEPPVAA